MSVFLSIHPANPQLRLVRRAIEVVRDGGVAAFPTDSTYAIGCHLEDKTAVDRIRKLRALDKDHHLTLMCRDLSELSTYARVDNASYRTLRRYLPGPYTFILPASREVPRRLVHRRRKTIGLRVPAHPVAEMMLAELGEPIMTTTLKLPGDEYPLADAEEIRERLERSVDVIVDSGPRGVEPTTVIDLVDGVVDVTRQGLGVV